MTVSLTSEMNAAVQFNSKSAAEDAAQTINDFSFETVWVWTTEIFPTCFVHYLVSTQALEDGMVHLFVREYE